MQFEEGMDLLGTVCLLGKCTVCARVIFSFPGGGWVTWPVVTEVGVVTLEQVGGESPFWKWILQQDLGKRVGMFGGLGAWSQVKAERDSEGPVGT